MLPPSSYREMGLVVKLTRLLKILTFSLREFNIKTLPFHVLVLDKQLLKYNMYTQKSQAGSSYSYLYSTPVPE